MWLWIVITILVSVFIAEEVINNWNKDPLGNRKKFNRPKNSLFKTYYGLTEKQSVADFEIRMASGMFSENKEIFVTAFCKGDNVERVTASIGSNYHCSNSDNVYKWTQHATRLGCDEIRQYHNHPNVSGRKRISRNDLRTHEMLSQIHSASNIRFRSFLVYANYFKGWEIIEIKC